MTLPEGYETQPEVGDPRGKDAESTEQTVDCLFFIVHAGLA